MPKRARVIRVLAPNEIKEQSASAKRIRKNNRRLVNEKYRKTRIELMKEPLQDDLDPRKR